MMAGKKPMQFLKTAKNSVIGGVNVFIYLYAIIKYTLQKYEIAVKNKDFIIIFTTVVIFPLCFVTLLMLKIYHVIIFIILKIIHGSNLHSIMEGTDVFFAVIHTSSSRCTIPAILLVQTDDAEDLRRAITSEVRLTFSRNKFEKLRCIRKQFGGYHYYLRKKGVPEQCFKTFGTLGEEMSAGTVQECVGALVNKALPMDDEGMWDLHIGLSTIVMDDGKKCVPLVFRFHHCLGDASTVYNIFSKDFATKKKVFGASVFEDKPSSVVVNKLEEAFVKSFVVIDEQDESVLNGNSVSGNKITAWFSDDSTKYLDVIKEVKKKNANLTFVDVILTASCAALHDHAFKKFDILPKLFTTVITTLFQSNEGRNSALRGDYTFDNKFTIALAKLPLKSTSGNKQDDIVERLKLVKEEYGSLKNRSLDFFFNRWQGEVLFTYLPSSLTKKMVNYGKPTFLFSNIPGCDKFEILDGLPVEDFVIFAPNVITSGITLMVSTYDNRLNLAFQFDKTIVQTTEEAQIICNNCLNYLEKLNK